MFYAANLNKRSLALDVKRGRDVLLRLVEDADVFLQSLRPGTASRLGFGPEQLRVSNPRPVAGTKPLEAVTVVEICNDNMPFLLDSVLGEIAAQGSTVRLVAQAKDRTEKILLGENVLSRVRRN